MTPPPSRQRSQGPGSTVRRQLLPRTRRSTPHRRHCALAQTKTVTRLGELGGYTRWVADEQWCEPRRPCYEASDRWGERTVPHRTWKIGPPSRLSLRPRHLPMVGGLLTLDRSMDVPRGHAGQQRRHLRDHHRPRSLIRTPTTPGPPHGGSAPGRPTMPTARGASVLTPTPQSSCVGISRAERPPAPTPHRWPRERCATWWASSRSSPAGPGVHGPSDSRRARGR